MENAVKFEKSSFGKRLGSMLKVDFRRMFRSKLFYILIACALVIPILITVMMTMMDGSISVDPQTGVETVMHGPENAWHSIGSLPGDEGAAMSGMDVMAMCNINMMFMGAAVFICLYPWRTQKRDCPVNPKKVRKNKMNKNNQEFLVQKIRTQYTEKESTKLDELNALDAQVKRPANIFAYVFGSISAIIMGSGMSLVMTGVGETVGLKSPMTPGIAIGVIGLLMAIINYPIYKTILGSRREKYADKIIALSDKIMKG